MDAAQGVGQAVAVFAAQCAGGVDEAAPVLHILAGLAHAAGADADLHRVRGADDALLNGFVRPGAVAGWLAEVVGPGVAVGIEVDDGQRLALAEAGLRGLEQRQRDGMVAAQKHGMVLAHQRPGLALDVGAHLVQRRGVGQAHVARIGQIGQRRHVEHGVDAIAQHQAGAADGFGPEAGTGPVGHGTVVRHTGQHKRGLRLQGQRGGSQKAVAVVGVGKFTHAHANISLEWLKD